MFKDKKHSKYVDEQSNKGDNMRENRSSGFPTRSDTNWPVQTQKQARSLKLWI